jgi:pyruvate, orthophosphate dikinase
MSIVLLGGTSAEPQSATVIGAKAANLARMAALGLPVPPAFVLPVKLCADLIEKRAAAEEELRDGLRQGIAFLESETGKRFGDRRKPLLVSVRSGAARSMPGMLETVLNVGCTSAAVQGLIRLTGRPRLAWDCRRRFLESFAETVLGRDPAPVAAELAKLVAGEGVANDRELDSEALERLAADEQAMLEGGDGWLEDADAQLNAAAMAVFQSWMSERAQTYRRLQKLEYLEGTAVTVQAMVFGNGGLASGAGVAFSRDPSTGAARPVVDLVLDAQGEDVVSGRRVPDTEEMIAWALPNLKAEIGEVLQRLEREFRDVQDVEFTVENGKLWVLQTRSAKRTPSAALRIAIDLVHEGLIGEREALVQIAELDLGSLAETSLVSPGQPAASGIGASRGIAFGRAAFDSESVQRLAAAGESAILMRPDTSTADVAGFAAAAGIVTAVGARTAHAALVARQMGKPCIVGCSGLSIDASAGQARIGDFAICAGDWITIDGDSGNLFRGRLETVTTRPEAELAEIARWRSQDTSEERGGPKLLQSVQ